MIKWNELKRMNNEYYNLSDIYCGSREDKLIGDIIGCLSRNDIAEFKNKWNEYDMICNLERWKVDILHHILEYMEHEDIINEIVGYDEEDICGNDNDNNVEKEQEDPFDLVLSENELNDAPSLID